MDDSRWLEEQYRNNYRMLCGVACLFLKSKPARRSGIEDEVHEVSVPARQKRGQLKRHPHSGEKP